MNDKKVSPLKDKPLRQTGQGVRELMSDYLFDNIFKYFFIFFLSFAFMIFEWVRYFFPLQLPHPYVFTIIFVFILIWFLLGMKKISSNLEHMRIGRDGEIIVGQILGDLTSGGFQILHDIPANGDNGKRFNLDHVLVGTRGVFVVETKTYSKKINATNTIEASEMGLLISGYTPKKDILYQSSGEAKWLADMLMKKIGKSVNVKPILTFPGWWIEPSAQKFASKHGVLLVNPKAIGQYINNEPEILSKEDVILYSNLISSYVSDFKED